MLFICNHLSWEALQRNYHPRVVSAQTQTNYWLAYSGLVWFERNQSMGVFVIFKLCLRTFVKEGGEEQLDMLQSQDRAIVR